MAKQRKTQYVISWEKDESDAKLDDVGPSSFVPGVTHLQRVNTKPHGRTYHGRSKTNPKTMGMMHPVKGGMQHVNSNLDGLPGEGKEDVSLKNLRPEDKKRVANLIKELAKVGEQKEEVIGQLAAERNQFKAKYGNLETQMRALQSERESIQQQYLQCQKLLAESQERLSKEQREHMELFRNAEPERDVPSGTSSKKTKLDSSQPKPESSPIREQQQFHPQFQSTSRPKNGKVKSDQIPHSSFVQMHSVQHRDKPMMHYHHSASRPTKTGQLSHPQLHHQIYSEMAHTSEKELSNPFSPTIFSADEFHPLPQELCSTSLIDSAVGTIDPVRGGEPGGHPDYKGKESARYHNHSHDQQKPTQGTHPSLRQRSGNGKEHCAGTEVIHKIDHSSRPQIIPHANNTSKVPSGSRLTQNDQRTNHHLHVFTRGQKSSSHQEGMVTPEQLSQSSGRRSPMDTWDNPHLRNGNFPHQKDMATPDMLVERKKRLEEQKGQLRREQEWLQKQLKNQEELLHQKQLELEAHRQSLLDSPRPWNEPGRHRGGYTGTGMNGNTEQVLNERQLLVNRKESLVGQHLGSAAGRTNGMNDVQQQVLHEKQLLGTHGGSLSGRHLEAETRHTLDNSQTRGHLREGLKPEMGMQNGMSRYEDQVLDEQQIQEAHKHSVGSRESRRLLLNSPYSMNQPLDGMTSKFGKENIQQRAPSKQHLYQEGPGQYHTHQHSVRDRMQGRVQIGREAVVCGSEIDRIREKRNSGMIKVHDEECVEDGMMRAREERPNAHRDPCRIRGSVSLHSDSLKRSRKAYDPVLNATGNATAPLQRPPRKGGSPAVRHPGSGLTEATSTDDASSDEPPEIDNRLTAERALSHSLLNRDDLNLLHDLIEDLNGPPSTDGSDSDRPLTHSVPASVQHKPKTSSRYHSLVDRTGIQFTQHRTTLLDDPSLTRIVGSEIVESSDGEEESQILDDIFFLN